MLYVRCLHCEPILVLSISEGLCCAGTQQQVQVEVRTISDIEKDYALVRTKLSLLRRDPSMAAQIYSE